MVSKKQQPSRSGRVVIRSIALPSEHGGWGFLIEPILLGLLVAFSWQGALFALAAVGAFLIHQPLKIATKDRLRGRRPPRLIWAERFVVVYGLSALLPTLVLLFIAGTTFLIPIALAVPLAATQLYFDLRNQSRQLLPELCGAAALAMIAPAIVILADASFIIAASLWFILTLRALVSVLYVRSRIRLKGGKATSPVTVWTIHALALLSMVLLAAAEIAPILVVIPFIILFFRAAVGLSRLAPDHSVKAIGFQEIGFGLMTVIIVALGF